GTELFPPPSEGRRGVPRDHLRPVLDGGRPVPPDQGGPLQARQRLADGAPAPGLIYALGDLLHEPQPEPESTKSPESAPLRYHRVEETLTHVAIACSQLQRIARRLRRRAEPERRRTARRRRRKFARLARRHANVPRALRQR